MSFSPIDKIESTAPVRDESSWVDQYKEAFVEHQHDTSQLTLILPDDCLVVVGPPRLSHASSENSFYPVGFLNSINISETRNVQPMKAIGSRRHIFAATNAPVQGSIGRLLFLGRNMLNALYANADFGPGITDRNSKYNGSAISDDGIWNDNLEEDIFRVPFGMGIVYNAPATLADGSVVAGAQYLEVCTLLNRNTAIQSGQAMIMEQVSFMADRLVPWTSYDTLDKGALDAFIGSYGSLN